MVDAVQLLDTSLGFDRGDDYLLNRQLPQDISRGEVGFEIGSGDTILLEGRLTADMLWAPLLTVTSVALEELTLPPYVRARRTVDGGSGDSKVWIRSFDTARYISDSYVPSTAFLWWDIPDKKSVSASGGNITAIVDKSGNGNDAVASDTPSHNTSSDQINGLDTAGFASANARLLRTLSASKAMACCVVVGTPDAIIDDGATGQTLMGFKQGLGFDTWEFGAITGGFANEISLFREVNGSIDAWDSASDAISAAPHIFVLRRDTPNALWQVYIDGGSDEINDTTSGPTQGIMAGIVQVGANGNESVDMDWDAVAEVIVMSSGPSDAVLNNMIKQLGIKYAISTSVLA